MSPRRELLIDAFNVIFAHPRLGPLVRRDPEAARHEFLEYVQAHRPADSSRVTVVFDAHRDPGPATETGRQRREYSSSVHVVFARETADVWIQKRIRESKRPGLITVVTSDREILETVRAHGAQRLPVRQFLQLRPRTRRRAAGGRGAGGAADKPSSMSRRELEELERMFEERKKKE